MNSIRRIIAAAVVVVVVGILCARDVARGTPNTAVASSYGNPRTYTVYSPYDFNSRQVLKYITYKTADSGYSAFTQSYVNGDPSFGYGACNGALTHPDRSSCLKTAISDLSDLCSMSAGAQT